MSDANSENKQRAVLVENLSLSVTEKTLNDFFFLCGPIESITLSPRVDADGEAEESQVAVVVFEKSEAADTAVLLTNAVLVDRALTVRYFNPETGLQLSSSLIQPQTPQRYPLTCCQTDAQFAKGKSNSAVAATTPVVKTTEEATTAEAAPAAAAAAPVENVC